MRANAYDFSKAYSTSLNCKISLWAKKLVVGYTRQKDQPIDPILYLSEKSIERISTLETNRKKMKVLLSDAVVHSLG